MENARQTVQREFRLSNFKNCGKCCMQYAESGNDYRPVQFSKRTIHGWQGLSKYKFVRSHFAKENTS